MVKCQSTFPAVVCGHPTPACRPPVRSRSLKVPVRGCAVWTAGSPRHRPDPPHPRLRRALERRRATVTWTATAEEILATVRWVEATSSNSSTTIPN